MSEKPPHAKLLEVLRKNAFRRHLQSRLLPPVPKLHCRWCGEAVTPPRRNWCSQECVDQFMIRNNSGDANRALLRRDQGVCDVCGIDTIQVRRWMRQDLGGKYSREQIAIATIQWGPWGIDYTRQLWEGDHIIPVIEGGGCCGLENLRTLCLPCHKADTSELAKRRASQRKRKGQLSLF